MTLLNLLLQATPDAADSVAAGKLQAVADSASVITKKALTGQASSIDWSALLQTLAHEFMDFALHLVAAIVVFYVGRFIVNRLHAVLRAIMVSRQVDPSLTTFLLSFVKITLLFVLIIMVIGILGIQTSSLIAIFASAGVAIGMALSGTLQNFAGGVLILFIKPYKVGDYIEFGQYKGFVREIQIFHTIITTYNNERIIIPNGTLSTGTINNFSGETMHREEWRVSIAYGDDVDVARRTILGILAADPRVVQRKSGEAPGNDERHHETEDEADNQTGQSKENEKVSFWKLMFKPGRLKEKVQEQQRHSGALAPTVDTAPGPYVAVDELADSAVVLVVRAWVKEADYWNVRYDVSEAIYNQLPLAGIHFPFPQMDVNLKKI